MPTPHVRGSSAAVRGIDFYCTISCAKEKSFLAKMQVPGSWSERCTHDYIRGDSMANFKYSSSYQTY